jgi:hypothetical protein
MNPLGTRPDRHGLLISLGEIDEMTLPQYRELAAYWQEFPQIHLLFAKVLGYRADIERTNDLSDLPRAFGRGGHIAKI